VFGNPKNDENIYHYDFSGMYASVMLEKYPFGRIIEKTENFDIENEPGFYHIEIESNGKIPVLPIRDEHKLIFPNGIITG
jgi:hypothetical protein